MAEKINMLAIVVALLANFIFGFLWYTPLFGKVWGREMGFDTTVKPEAKLMIKGLLFMLIGNFLLAFVLAHDLAAWSYVTEMGEMNPLVISINSAFFTWLGFYVPGLLGSTVWERKSWTLVAINGSYQLLSLFIVALILTHWK